MLFRYYRLQRYTFIFKIRAESGKKLEGTEQKGHKRFFLYLSLDLTILGFS